MNKIRILLVDDHTIMRMGLVTLIDNTPDLSVVGEAATGEEAVRLARELKPNIVLMDLMMPGLSGAEATKLIRTENPAVRVVILTTYGQSAELAVAVRNGAAATLLKDTDTTELTDVLRAVHAGQEVIPPDVRTQIEEDDAATTLTERQLAILAALTKGYSNPEIARQFGISEIGVKKHLQAIFAKLGASSRSEAVAIALRKQLLKI